MLDFGTSGPLEEIILTFSDGLHLYWMVETPVVIISHTSQKLYMVEMTLKQTCQVIYTALYESRIQ